MEPDHHLPVNYTLWFTIVIASGNKETGSHKCDTPCNLAAYQVVQSVCARHMIQWGASAVSHSPSPISANHTTAYWQSSGKNTIPNTLEEQLRL